VVRKAVARKVIVNGCLGGPHSAPWMQTAGGAGQGTTNIIYKTAVGFSVRGGTIGCIAIHDYSGFASSAYRIDADEWLFP
jgi:hypothetical protein